MLTLKYYDREAGKTVTFELPANVDVVEIQVPPNRQPPYETSPLPGLKVNVNTDGIVVDVAKTGSRVAAYEFSDLVAEWRGEGNGCPEYKGYEVVYSCNAHQDKPDYDPGSEDECTHYDRVTYTEDGSRFCGCRNCGAIWELLPGS